MAVNRYKEYAAARNLVNAIGTIYSVEMYKILEISMISLIKLIEGGPAIFMVIKINHIMVIEGTRFIRPFVRNILRVWAVS